MPRASFKFAQLFVSEIHFYELQIFVRSEHINIKL
jgi:hypothetical protein